MNAPVATIASPMGRKRKELDESIYSNRLALHIRGVRERQGITVQRISKRLGISRFTYYTYENGGAQFPLDLMPKIARILRVTIRELFPEE
jgi:DNA-binding XRE family transcriptional regulator